MAGIELQPNPKYSLGEKANNHLIIKVVKSEKTRLAKLRAGELDIVQNSISRDVIKSIEKVSKLKVQKRSALKTTYVGFNTRDKYLGNEKVRKAMPMAFIANPLLITS